ncbi:unnamed protein product [Caenorhabditis angaria]|uniref:Ribosomal protein eL8/eL30/eS12/Gadd45 domain-containing protein n=1 Tax=Caenorhabditis angaria TaxID=860376 RepID=A0A9P1I8A2_9PELO|nr:unnamed protein product [Caenorhabditis angaria]
MQSFEILAELDENVLNLLKILKLKRDVVFENEVKGMARRRIVMGFHEILKYLKSGRIKAVIVARNMNWQEEARRGLKNMCDVEKICVSQGIPLISASTKRILGRILQKHPYISAIGIFDISGYEEEFQKILNLWKIDDAFKMYHLDQNSMFA